MGWLNRAQRGKDYDGAGGYVLSCYVRPESCLVDLNHPDIPDWGWTGRGNEGEVILMPDQTLVTKVFKTVGDLEREVEEFLSSKYRKPRDPTQEEFWEWAPSRWDYKAQVEGDASSGRVTLISPDPIETRKKLEGSYGDLLSYFTSNLYRAEWTGLDTLTYRSLRLPGGGAARVAQRWLGGGGFGAASE